MIIVYILYNKFDGFRMYHGEVEIEPYVKLRLGTTNDTLHGYYHLRCYRKAIDNEKHNLKKILAFFQDTSIVKTVLDSTVELHKHRTDYDREGDIYWFEKRDYYDASYIKSDPTYFSSFSTWAKPRGGSYPRKPIDYTRQKVGNDYIISFPYDAFDVQVWQKFLDIKDYDWWHRHDSTVHTYKLKNPQTDSIECIIETRIFPERRIGFKMEIL